MKYLILLFALLSFGCHSNIKILEKKVLENNQIIKSYEKLSNSLYDKIRELDSELSKKSSVIESLKKENIDFLKNKDFLKICRNNLFHYKKKINSLKSNVQFYQEKLFECHDEQTSDKESDC